jgi:hypothetical protein
MTQRSTLHIGTLETWQPPPELVSYSKLGQNLATPENDKNPDSRRILMVLMFTQKVLCEHAVKIGFNFSTPTGQKRASPFDSPWLCGGR